MTAALRKALLVARFIAWSSGFVVVLTVTAFSVIDFCNQPATLTPTLVYAIRTQGDLKVGAARIEIAPPFPVSRAGYGLAGPSSVTTGMPIYARAMVLEVDNQRVIVVSVETLYVTDKIRQAVAADVKSPVLIVATHSHSSLGGFDRRLIAQVAGAGRFRSDVEQSIVTAARSAIATASQRLQAAHIETAVAPEVGGLTVARSGISADRRLTTVKFVAENTGQTSNGSSTIGQWIMFAAHPTLVPIDSTQLDSDWPGRLSQQYEGNGGQITFVFQTAVGNSSIDRSEPPTPDGFSMAVGDRVNALTFAPVASPVDLRASEARIALPKPDASRLVPTLMTRLVENSICHDNPNFTTAIALQLGNFSMVALPFEVTADAAAELLASHPGSVAISLANDYMGYLESVQRLGDGSGEGARQYFGAELFHAVRDGIALTIRPVSTNDQ